MRLQGKTAGEPSKTTAAGGASPAASPQLTGLPSVQDAADAGNQIKALLNAASVFEAVVAPDGCHNVDVGIEAYGAAFPSKDLDFAATNNNPQGCNASLPPSTFYSIRSGAVVAKADGCSCQQQSPEWQRLSGLYGSATQPADFRIQSGNIVPVGVGSSGTTPPPMAAPRVAPPTEAPTTTTPPATVTVPTVDDDPADPGSFQLEVKPASIDVSGFTGNVVTNISWLAWDNHGATGHGIVADTLGSQSPVTLYLNDPINGVFSLLTEVTPGEPNSGQNIPLPTAPGQKEGIPTPSTPGQTW